VGQPLADIDVEEEVEEAETTPSVESPVVEPPKEAEKQPEVEAPVRKSSSSTLATPAVRHVSKQLGIDISEVNGTGKDGRVMKSDLHSFDSNRTSSSGQQLQGQSKKDVFSESGDAKQLVSGLRKQMLKNMTRSLSIPHFLYTSNVDFTSITKLRASLKQNSDLKLSPLPIIIKAVSMAFHDFPELNSHLDTTDLDHPQWVHKQHHNFGIAIDSPRGLVVPVIRNVETLSIKDISLQIKSFAELARAGKLKAEDFAGATFTISNIGSVGGAAVAPVITRPQVAILGIGKARPVALWDDVLDRPKRVEECVFSWSADHRIVDGANVARAAEKVRVLIEQIGTLLVDMK
jgi:2-oxoisovalerate dehydrogenase E2 component (dihydrolipoyl transacylase)